MRTGTPAAHAGNDGLERGEIAGVHDRRIELPEQAVQPRIVAHEVPGRFLPSAMQRTSGRVDASCEFGGDIRQRHDRVPPSVRRHAVDQVDDPVLEPADAEAEDDVDDQRREALSFGLRDRFHGASAADGLDPGKRGVDRRHHLARELPQRFRRGVGLLRHRASRG